MTLRQILFCAIAAYFAILRRRFNARVPRDAIDYAFHEFNYAY